MLNNISVSDFLVANPNSSTCNKAFKQVFKGTDFLKEFYVISNKTFERLAEIAYVSNDITKNTVFITGYRGCGKTCFMNFLDNLLKGDFRLNEFHEYLNYDINLTKEIFQNQRNFIGSSLYHEQQEEIAEIGEKYNKTEEKIKMELAAQLVINEYTDISEYLNDSLKGYSIYLNFERGMNTKNIPFNLKFTQKILIEFGDLFKLGKNKNGMTPFSLLYELYQEFTDEFETTFENQNSILYFMDFIEKKVLNAKRYVDIREELDKKLSVMSLEQLLMILVMLYISKEICFGEKEYSKIYILLDNMDIVYRQTLFEQSMHSYSYFIENMNSLMEELEKKGAKSWSIIYENITFIFAMRETTAMQISDHFIDGMEQNMLHFDMSKDTNKSLIVEKKYQFISAYKDKIENRIMLRILDDVYRICTDYYTKNNIFPMFNNDFKRSTYCISKICEENESIMQQHKKLNCINRPFTKNGARGMVFRLIYDKFKSEHYFEKIGIEPYHYKYTPARIILTILYNYLPDNENEDDDFENLNPRNVNMKTLYTTYADIITDPEMFINSIIGMFSLKNERMWNHLITFDNIKEVSEKGLKEFIEKYINGESVNTDIKLRITDSGKNYIKFICTHFEFYSCRFCEDSKALFCKENFIYDSKEDVYVFEEIIEEVYRAVRRCCYLLKEYNQSIVEKYKDNPNKDLLSSKYVFRNKTEKIGILHEERVIHRHITYIDNFRMYLIQLKFPNKCIDINKRLINKIKKYVKLMNNRYMSSRSTKLKEEFKDCIEYIEKVKDYDDNKTEISEKSYEYLKAENLI